MRKSFVIGLLFGVLVLLVVAATITPTSYQVAINTNWVLQGNSTNLFRSNVTSGANVTLSYNVNGGMTIASSPWTGDTDADGWDLDDLNQIDFRGGGFVGSVSSDLITSMLRVNGRLRVDEHAIVVGAGTNLHSQYIRASASNTVPLIIDTPNGYVPEAALLAIKTNGVVVAQVNSNGTLTVLSDLDAATILGRVRIDSRSSDVAYWSHFDMSSSGNYAIRQSAGGVTVLNSANGQDLNFSINDTGQWKVDASGDFIASTDNTDYIGLVGAGRPRGINVGTDGITNAGNYVFTNGVQLNQAGTAILEIIPFGTADMRFTHSGGSFVQIFEASGSIRWSSTSASSVSADLIVRRTGASNLELTTDGTSFASLQASNITAAGRFFTTNGANIVAGPLVIGSGGGSITNVLVGSAALDFGDIAVGAFENKTITVTGAAEGDEVSLGIPHGTINGIAVIFQGWVSAADTVTVRAYCTDTAVSTGDLASGTFKVKVTKW